jgi:tRNA (mo5U34)-methyltransferase
VSEPGAGTGGVAGTGDLHWYHTLELPGGELTPGWFDTRRTVARMPWPERPLEGRRCLDVGTWDGFWAFEMERRGAAEVVAIDLDEPGGWDWPAGSPPGSMQMLELVKAGNCAFDTARAALGSGVQRQDLSVYDLDPERVGRFDLVFIGSLLLHLRDPVRALQRIRAVTRGEAIVADTIELIPSLRWPRRPVARLEGHDRPLWWQPNAAALRRMVQAAGFEIVDRTGIYFIPLGKGHPRAPLHRQWRDALTPAGRERLIARWPGIPHTAVRARPAPTAAA